QTLDPLELVRIERELEDVRRLRVGPCELGVPCLVRERAETGRAVEADEEVRDPAPAAGREDSLVDDLGSGAQRFLRAARGVLEVDLVALHDLDDLAALISKPCEKRRLVLLALAADEIRLRALPPRPLELVPLDADVELRQVRTREVIREVGGREPERAVGGEAHFVGVSAARRRVLMAIGHAEGPTSRTSR